VRKKRHALPLFCPAGANTVGSQGPLLYPALSGITIASAKTKVNPDRSGNSDLIRSGTAAAAASTSCNDSLRIRSA